MWSFPDAQADVAIYRGFCQADQNCFAQRILAIDKRAIVSLDYQQKSKCLHPASNVARIS